VRVVTVGATPVAAAVDRSVLGQMVGLAQEALEVREQVIASREHRWGVAAAAVAAVNHRVAAQQKAAVLVLLGHLRMGPLILVAVVADHGTPWGLTAVPVL
jgi:hypothetical protein